MFQYSVDYAHTDLLISMMNSNDSTVSARIGEAVLASKKKNQAALAFFSKQVPLFN